MFTALVVVSPEKDMSRLHFGGWKSNQPPSPIARYLL